MDRPMFLFTGRIIRGKGIGSLLQACRLLKQRGFNRFSVVLVGDGLHKEEMRRLARDLGVDNQVRWKALVPYDNLGAYYQACDVFVLPSLEDTWGVVVQEAMVFGKAVLCSQYAGAKQIVQHGVNGFVFDANNPEELADYMERLICAPRLIAKFGSASKEIVEQYTPKRSAATLGKAVIMVMHPEGAHVASDSSQETPCTLVSKQ